MLNRIITCCALYLVCCGIAHSESGKKENFYLNGGISAPSGTLADGWNLGFHGRGAVGFTVSEPRTPTSIEILCEASFHSFSLNKRGSSVSGGDASAILLGAGPKITFSNSASQVKFFLSGTVGAGIVGISDLTVPGLGTLHTNGETKIYFSPSVGVEVGKDMFFSAGYVSITTSGSAFAFFPIAVGVRL